MIRRVIGVPRRPIRVLPLLIRHFRTTADAMVEVVFVQVDIHPGALLQKDLVILRAGQRGQEENLRTSSGSSRLMISMSRRIDPLVSPGKPKM